MPVNRLKLVAFAFGAAIAGLTGTLFAALNTAVFAADFDVPTLIIIYAMLILGGAGSLGGVILGALVVNVSLEVLRTPGHATWIFYIVLPATLLVKLRPWRWLAIVVGGTVAPRLRGARDRRRRSGRAVSTGSSVGGGLGGSCRAGCCIPTNPKMIGNVAFVVLVLAVLALTLLNGWQRRDSR